MTARVNQRIAIPVAAVLLIVAVLVAAQIALPTIAADHIRDQLKKNGKVISVSVSAFPAIELLWHQADTVKVRMASYHSGTSHLTSLLDQSSDVGTLDASAQTLTDGLLTVHNATLSKRGSTLTGTAVIEVSDLRRAFPILQSASVAANTNGQLVVEGRANVPILGDIEVPVVVQAQGGRLIAAPDIPLVGSLFTFQLFSDPRVAVTGVSARSNGTGSFAVTAQGTLH